MEEAKVDLEDLAQYILRNPFPVGKLTLESPSSSPRRARALPGEFRAAVAGSGWGFCTDCRSAQNLSTLISSVRVVPRDNYVPMWGVPPVTPSGQDRRGDAGGAWEAGSASPQQNHESAAFLEREVTGSQMLMVHPSGVEPETF